MNQYIFRNKGRSRSKGLPYHFQVSKHIQDLVAQDAVSYMVSILTSGNYCPQRWRGPVLHAPRSPTLDRHSNKVLLDQVSSERARTKFNFMLRSSRNRFIGMKPHNFRRFQNGISTCDPRAAPKSPFAKKKMA